METTTRHNTVEALLSCRRTAEVSISRVDDPARLDGLTIDRLLEVSRHGFGRGEMQMDEILEHVMGTDSLQLLHFKGELAGFAAYSLLEMDVSKTPDSPEQARRVLYLNGIVMHKDAQGFGIAPLALMEALKEHDPEALVLRTQNPAMYAALRNMADGMGFEHRIFPSMASTADFEASEIARKVAEMLKEKNYDPLRSFEAGTYGMALNDTIPRVDGYTERLFERLGIDREAGDSIIAVAMLRHLKKRNLRTFIKLVVDKALEAFSYVGPIYPGM